MHGGRGFKPPQKLFFCQIEPVADPGEVCFPS